MRGLAMRAQASARVSLLLVAAPGLAFALDHLTLDRQSAADVLVLRLILLTAGALLTFHLAGIHHPGTPDLPGGHREHISMLVVLAFAMLASAERTEVPFVLVLLAASVEEVLFRRHLPASLAPVLQRLGFGRLARSVAILASQVAFATAHFTVSPYPASFAPVTPFIRLVAAGCFLALIYESSGFAVAVAAHTALNLGITTGRLGTFIAPPTLTLAWCLVAGVLGVITLVECQRRLRLPFPSRCHSTDGRRDRRITVDGSLRASPSSR